MPTLVSTGQLTLTDVNDGLHARLSSESHLIPAGAEGEDGDYSGCSTTMTVLMGAVDDTTNWSFSAAPTAGVVGSLVGSTYTVTNLTTDAGYVDITASRVGFPSLTSRFSLSKAKRGWAGPAISLIASASGFSFKDGVATPAAQSIAFTVVRNGATAPVTFYATGGALLQTDEGQLSLSNYSLGTYGCGQGDTAYLDLSGFGENQQVTVTAVCGELTASHTVVRLDSSSAEAGATRNVHRGVWAAGAPYSRGDTVLHGGYGWAALVDHSAAAGVNEPPTYPTTSNTWWTLAAVKGEDAKMAMLTASSFVFRVAQDGSVTPSSIALTAIGQNLAGSPAFSVYSGTATLTGTGDSRVLTAANLSTDQATIKISWDGRDDYVTITKVREGSNALQAVLSNEAHVFPASAAGTVSSYANSGTTIAVYEGATALTYDGTGTANGTWKIATSASNITVGSVTDSGSFVTVGQHSGVADGTDASSITYTITGKTLNGTAFSLTKTQSFSKAKVGAAGADGTNGLTVVMSNESHTLPADSAGVVSSYTNSGTTFQVYEGGTLLTAGGSSNGSFTVGTPAQSPASTITAGSVSYADNTATVAVHSAMDSDTDSVVLTFPVTVKRLDGTSVTINKAQTLTKSKQGSTGAQGPSVTITTSRAASFTSTDGTLDGGQSDITFTAIVSGISSPTYSWTFSGFQTAPTNSGASTQVVTAAQFGTAKSATVKCTVSGNNNYVDIVTIVRIEKSTAEAGATVGADADNFTGIIGGENLVMNGNFDIRNGNQPYGVSLYNNGGSGGQFIASTGYVSGSGAGVKAGATAGSTLGIISASNLTGGGVTGGVEGGWKANTTYVVSFMARKVAGAGFTNMALRWNVQPAATVSIANPNLTTSYQRYAFRVTTGASVEANGSVFITAVGTPAANDEVHIDRLQVELGQVQTQWKANRRDAISVSGSNAPSGLQNSNIILNEDGTLTGGGAGSQQVNLTQIPGTLSADRITAGTMAANTSITVGATNGGIVIDANSRTIAVKAQGAWTTRIFQQSSTTPAQPANGTTAIPSGWNEYPLNTWTGTIWCCEGTVNSSGYIVWTTPFKITTGASTVYYFAKNTSKTVNPTTGYTALPPALSAGEYMWMRTELRNGSTIYSKSYYRISGEASTDGVYDALTVGKLGTNYGIVGRYLNTENFRLDDSGLELVPGTDTLRMLGGATGWSTVAEGTVTQTYEAGSGTGTVTTYIKLMDAYLYLGARFFVNVIGYFERWSFSTGTLNNTDYLSRYFATQVYTNDSDQLVSMGDVTIVSDTTDSTYFPASKASIIVDNTGATAGIAGVFLKLVSRTSMYDVSNMNYADYSQFRYVVWALEF